MDMVAGGRINPSGGRSGHTHPYSPLGHLHTGVYAPVAHTHSLNDLTDVDTTGLFNGSPLEYDSDSGLWVPGTDSAGGGGGGDPDPLIEESFFGATTLSVTGMDVSNATYDIELVFDGDSANVLVGMQLTDGGVADSTSGHYRSTRAFWSTAGDGTDDDYLGTDQWFVAWCSANYPGFMKMTLVNLLESAPAMFTVTGSFGYATSDLYTGIVSGRHSESTPYDGLGLGFSNAASGTLRIYRRLAMPSG